MSRIEALVDMPKQVADLFERAENEGEVLVKRDDGRVFAIRSVKNLKSPLDVPRVKLDLTLDEIVGFIREGRERVWDPEIMAYREGPWPGDEDYLSPDSDASIQND